MATVFVYPVSPRSGLRGAPFRRLLFALALLLAPLLFTGCSTPAGITRISTTESYRQSTSNPLNDGVLSNATRVVLQRYDLINTYADEPVSTLRLLHETALSDERRDLLFALAELSYLHGERLHGSNSWDDVAHAQDYFLLSALYAYLYLLDEGKESPPTAWDIKFREACDLYNRALGRGFPADEDGALSIGSRVRHLPMGELTIVPNLDSFNWKFDDFESFLPANNYEVYGFMVRNRTSGLGLPLIAVTKQSPEAPNGGALPVTAFLRITGGVAALGSGNASATMELYSAYDRTEVTVNGRTVPLETDSTAPLAYRLNSSAVWNLGLTRFLGGGRIDNHLLLVQPYEPGRIPVVFVHGTASSPVWWAEMLNTLRADPVIRKRFQFWFYQYNSSNMILLSAADLRDSLTDMVKQLDPEGKDPALRQMVVVGHSQGGLLTKMAVVAPGNKLWEGISDKNLDEMDANEELKGMARRMFFFEPLPFVKEVVFISTPHRGSFLTHEWVRNLVRKLVSIPFDIMTLDPKLFIQAAAQLRLPPMMRSIPTSVDGMSADNPNLKTLITLPLAPGVIGHSIIAVLPGMEIKSGNDGVVEYQSAHLDGVESEFIVRSGHSCQGHPFAIEEVRRILRKHIGVGVTGPEEFAATKIKFDKVTPESAAKTSPE